MASRAPVVLALDGGGIRGVLTAAVLAHVEDHLGIRLAERVALLTGTSTGAIIALALALGFPASQVLAAYQEAGPKIFGKGRSRLARYLRPAHDNQELVAWLRSFFGDRRLNDAIVPVAIPTFDASTGTPRVFKDDHASELHFGGHQLAWEVALASAAAPTYLVPVSIGGSGTFLDGGLWANNPSFVGYLEAIRYLRIPADDLRILSIGTGRRKAWFNLPEIVTWGQLQWVRPLLEIILDAQSLATEKQVGLLLGAEKYLRINVELPRDIPLDDTAAIPVLAHLGQVLGLESLRSVEALLGEHLKATG